MSEPMLTREQIKTLKGDILGDYHFGTSQVDKNRLAALCTMAISSIAMREALKPRPISEAPKDGTWLLACDGNAETWRPVQWVKSKNAWCDVPDGDRFENFVPTIFTSLPEPNAAEAYQEQGK